MERHVRITKPGWTSYTGPFGFVEFKDGVSVKAHPEREYDRVATELSIVDAETGEPLGVQARMISLRTARLVDPRTNEDKIAERELNALRETRAQALEVQAAVRTIYTEAELGKIIEAKGIHGLREVATPLKIKGRSIPDLVHAILKAQALLAPAPAPASPPSPPVPAL